VDQNTYLGKIQTSSQAAQQRGVDSTPTLFINGRKVVGAISLAQFESIAGQLLR
jgi:protein-disulfide isomerase